MKCEKLHNALLIVRQIFDEFAINSVISDNGLQECMKILHGNMSTDEVKELFDFVDVDASHTISLKEFLVALTVGMVLGVIPALVSGSDRDIEFNKNKTSSTNNFCGKASDVFEMLNLVVSAYMLFDPQGVGQISRKSVNAILEETNKSSNGSHNMMSQQKWNEMDWDNNGSIDMAEFIVSFSTWIDIDEEMANDGPEGK